MKVRRIGFVFFLCVSPATAGQVALFYSLLETVQITRSVPFIHPDIDRDCVHNIPDMDDDGDGVIDVLDSAPMDAQVSSRIDVKPWINEILIS